MSMMPLLSASRSLVGSRDLGKQYRMTDPKSLPKFGSKKKKAARGEPEARQNVAEKPQTPSGLEKHQTPNTNLQRNTKLQTPNSQAEAGSTVERRGLLGTWLAGLKKAFGRSERVRNAAIPRFSARPVQCELSLDNVKVLRNDLSDTDFEVIAKPAQPEKPKTPEARPQPAQANRENIWGRVTALLGAGQT